MVPGSCPLVVPLCGLLSRALRWPVLYAKGQVAPAYLRFLERRTYTSAPSAFREAVASIPRKRLSIDELSTFERDGVIVAKEVFPPGILRSVLTEVLDISANVTEGEEDPVPWREWQWRRQGQYPPQNQWATSGAIHSLVLDGPAGALASSLLGDRPVRLTYSSIIERNPRPAELRGGPPSCNGWHRDQLSAEEVGMFVALTDSPNQTAVTLEGGQHAERVCGKDAMTPWRWNAWGALDKCLMSPEHHQLAKVTWLTLRAGDVAIYRGSLPHAPCFSDRWRVSLRLAFVPADTPFHPEMALQEESLWYTSFFPAECASMDVPLFPLAHPRNSTSTPGWPLVPSLYDDLTTRHLRFWWREWYRPWPQPCPARARA